MTWLYSALKIVYKSNWFTLHSYKQVSKQNLLTKLWYLSHSSKQKVVFHGGFDKRSNPQITGVAGQHKGNISAFGFRRGKTKL